MEDIKAVQFENGKLKLIDQRILPSRFEYWYTDTEEGVFEAIRTMIVRGAPAIGGAAAYGAYFALCEAEGNADSFKARCTHLMSARPTAVNLEWSVRRMMRKAEETGYDKDALLREADLIVREDVELEAIFAEKLPTGIDAEVRGQGFIVRPLPLGAVMYLDGGFTSVKQLLVYGIDGTLRLAKSDVPRGEAVDVSSLGKGMYIIRVITDNGVHVKSVFKK